MISYSWISSDHQLTVRLLIASSKGLACTTTLLRILLLTGVLCAGAEPGLKGAADLRPKLLMLKAVLFMASILTCASSVVGLISGVTCCLLWLSRSR
jgi:hypothetical protein